MMLRDKRRPVRMAVQRLRLYRRKHKKFAIQLSVAKRLERTARLRFPNWPSFARQGKKKACLCRGQHAHCRWPPKPLPQQHEDDGEEEDVRCDIELGAAHGQPFGTLYEEVD